MKEITACRACGATTVPILKMGNLPLAGDFAAGPEAKRYPLTLQYCDRCDLLQTREIIPHKVLFNADYGYASSTVPALVDHFRALAEHISTFSHENAAVLEVGCNDGVLLKHLPAFNLRGVGVDASANVVALAQAAGLPAHHLSFGAETWPAALALNAGQLYDTVTCSNVFAHNADPNGFLEAVRHCLKVEGILVVEVHDAAELQAKLQWDCLYHEHCFYWSEGSLTRILARHGFALAEVARTSMHGGALRVTARKTRELTLGDVRVYSSLTVEFWQQFAARAERSWAALDYVLRVFHGSGAKVVLYGAAGRATTLVNWARLAGSFACAFDGSPLRHGKHVPGTSIRIFPESQLRDYLRTNGGSVVVLGAWHLGEPLVMKAQQLAQGSGALIISPLPEIVIR